MKMRQFWGSVALAFSVCMVFSCRGEEPFRTENPASAPASSNETIDVGSDEDVIVFSEDTQSDLPKNDADSQNESQLPSPSPLSHPQPGPAISPASSSLCAGVSCACPDKSICPRVFCQVDTTCKADPKRPDMECYGCYP